MMHLDIWAKEWKQRSNDNSKNPSKLCYRQTLSNRRDRSAKWSCVGLMSGGSSQCPPVRLWLASMLGRSVARWRLRRAASILVLLDFYFIVFVRLVALDSVIFVCHFCNVFIGFCENRVQHIIIKHAACSLNDFKRYNYVKDEMQTVHFFVCTQTHTRRTQQRMQIDHIELPNESSAVVFRRSR